MISGCFGCSSRRAALETIHASLQSTSSKTVAPGGCFEGPPNRSRALKLQQLSQPNRFFWSIHELELWER